MAMDFFGLMLAMFKLMWWSWLLVMIVAHGLGFWHIEWTDRARRLKRLWKGGR